MLFIRALPNGTLPHADPGFLGFRAQRQSRNDFQTTGKLQCCTILHGLFHYSAFEATQKEIFLLSHFF